MRVPTLILLTLIVSVLSASSQNYNRLKSAVSSLPLSLLDESRIFDTIASQQNKELTKALGREDLSAAPLHSLRLQWQQRIALKGADYILCLFDSAFHMAPGNNPRVLILFTPDYKLKTWGSFACEPAFAFGSLMNRLSDSDTYFITINPQHRFGGVLWFEKYLITPDRIHKIGEGAEITKIPDA